MAAAVRGGYGAYFASFKAWTGSGVHGTAGKIVDLVREKLLTHQAIIDLGGKKGWSGFNVTIKLDISFGQENLIAEIAKLLPTITHYETYQKMAPEDKSSFKDDVATRVVVELLKTLKEEHAVGSKSGTTITANITMIPLQVDSIKSVLREAAKTALIHNQYVDREVNASKQADDGVVKKQPLPTSGQDAEGSALNQQGAQADDRDSSHVTDPDEE